MAPSNVDWAYLAGLIDGDGWIGLRSGYNKNNDKFYQRPRVQVSNTSTLLLNEVQDKFGGQICQSNSNSNHLGKKPMYNWKTEGKARIEIMMWKMLPHLVLKKLNALKMIEFLGEHPLGVA